MIVGDRYIYTGNHCFYEVKSVTKKKILDMNSDVEIKFSLIKDDFSSNTNLEYSVDTKLGLQRWMPVKKDLILPFAAITEGMVINVRRHKHYVYNLDDKSFYVIPIEEKDPKTYLQKHRIFNRRIEIDWAQRLFYTGWWTM